MNSKDPAKEIGKITSFLKQTFLSQGKVYAVIAVSGGIDSALCLSLLARALPRENIYPLFLPYGDQPISDNELICEWNEIPKENWQTMNIQPHADSLCNVLDATDLRKGNIMARVRMICVFDQAKKLDALVCGTENKSEHYLGYFTRFGDAASDIEPISHLYKTQIRQFVEFLKLPKVFFEKTPSADLWAGQTDESEMGFSYADADRALASILGESSEKIDPLLLEKVRKVVDSQSFKLRVPYTLLPK